MKNFLLTVFVFTTLFSAAQDCGKYYYFQSNKAITMGNEKAGQTPGLFLFE